MGGTRQKPKILGAKRFVGLAVAVLNKYMKTNLKDGIWEEIQEVQKTISTAVFDQQNAKTEEGYKKAREKEIDYKEYLRVLQNARGGSTQARVTLAHQWGMGDCPGCAGCSEG